MAIPPTLIRPKDLPAAPSVNTDAAIPVDNGTAVQRATATQIVNTGRPFASQPEAEAGVSATTAMSPLTTKQAIEAQVPPVVQPYVDLAEAWAESPTNPDPMVPTSKSSKTWAGEAAASAVMAATYGPLTFPSIQAFFTSSLPTVAMSGKRAGTQNSSAVWDIVAPGSGDFNHPITGAGVRVSPVGGALVMDAFGIWPDDEAFAASNKAGMAFVRAAVSAGRARTVVPATQGVYWFSTETTMAAPGMRLIGGGATLKQQSGSQTTNWLLFNQADDIEIDNWEVDGNRVNAPSLNPDSSLFLVFDLAGAVISNIKVHGSSGKGMAIASGVTGVGASDVQVVGCSGWDCKTQVFVTDRSNGGVGDAIPCQDIVFDRINVGATDHAGIAINDGSRRVTLTNSVFDVQNSAWDAVAVRGSRQVKISNTIGRRGRNGIQISVLDAAAIARGEIADEIQLENNTWEGNQQNGFLSAGGTDVRVIGDVAKNNGQNGGTQYGFLVTQQTGVRGSSDVALTSVIAIDDQAVPTQHTGILAAASDRVKVTDPTMRGNTTANRVVYSNTVTGIQVIGDGPDGATRKQKSVTTGSIPGGGGTATVTLNFDTAFAVAPNQFLVSVSAATSSAALRVEHIISATTSAMSVRVSNANAGALTGTLYAQADYIG